MTAAPQGKEWLTVPQVARVLGIHVQSVYDAVKSGRMSARGQGRDLRIHAQEILGYAAKTGRNVDDVVKDLEGETGEIEWKKLAGWVLAAIGFFALMKYLKDE